MLPLLGRHKPKGNTCFRHVTVFGGRYNICRKGVTNMTVPAGTKAKFEGTTISKKVKHSTVPREIWRPLRGRQISGGTEGCYAFLEIVVPSNFAFVPAGTVIFVTPFLQMLRLPPLPVLGQQLKSPIFSSFSEPFFGQDERFCM